jgi:alpha-D-ribose 1-methylphosphonate 5-phosphate C-P lyase
VSWYTLFNQETGALIAPTPKVTLPTATIGVLITPEEPDQAANDWNAVSRSWVPKPNPTRVIISRKDFLDQFTAAELSAAMQLRRSSDLAVFGAIESFVLYVMVSTAIDLNDPQVIAGLDFLVTVGVLAPTRPAQIRTPLPL